MTATATHGRGQADPGKLTRHTITVVMAVIASLAFVFSFGNIWALALRLGVPRPIAPLIGPMVDLSVVGLLVALHHLTLTGTNPQHLAPARRLMHVCGFLTLALNIAEPLAAGHWGRAALDTVAPTLLLGWGAVGPTLLAHLHTPTTPKDTTPNQHARPATLATAPPTPATEPTSGLATPLATRNATPAPAPEAEPTPPTPPTVALAHQPEPVPAPAAAAPAPAAEPAPVAAPPVLPDVPGPLLAAARRIADDHRAATGDLITPAQLRARLGVPAQLAAAAHTHLAAVPA
ncbi:DUF2637 domain-containing protein [Streptomyces sp. TLI_171]|uniref:DUF2637 domain-containing protein n=1 Tax=Streptomyces sp. TLI_171 TaxID=1938859 RepID=UPI000C183EC2|nr:DUF2637 domain-containing protein [Streptomyces sp. TLI_171]RKE19989.1 uncharacterized protein DUF2637 [Streptomyces sp. TLI_171]